MHTWCRRWARTLRPHTVGHTSKKPGCTDHTKCAPAGPALQHVTGPRRNRRCGTYWWLCEVWKKGENRKRKGKKGEWGLEWVNFFEMKMHTHKGRNFVLWQIHYSTDISPRVKKIQTRQNKPRMYLSKPPESISARVIFSFCAPSHLQMQVKFKINHPNKSLWGQMILNPTIGLSVLTLTNLQRYNTLTLYLAGSP